MHLYENNEGLGTVHVNYGLNLDFGDYIGSDLCVHVWGNILDCWHELECGLDLVVVFVCVNLFKTLQLSLKRARLAYARLVED